MSRRCVGYWYARWVELGEAGLVDASSRPHRSPRRTPAQVEAQVCRLRRELKVGPVQLVAALQEVGVRVAASTVHRILVREGISRLRDLDITGQQLREPVRRYEHDRAGSLVHVDVKKLGRIPDGGGWRVHGRGSAQHRIGETARHAAARARRKNNGRPGYLYLHSAVDDHSRLAYTEELPDEKGPTAAAFWARAAHFFHAHGITVITRVLTDNGACYRSQHFTDALATTGTRHLRTRPYRPQTNGKVERYHRTLAREWAYRQPWNNNDQRSAALKPFLDRYNYARPHTAIGKRPPVTRTPTGDTNLTG